MIDPWNRNDDFHSDVDDELDALPTRKRNRDEKRRRNSKAERLKRSPGNSRGRERVESRDGTFRCRHCKTIVGVPISGGRHRNHCPLCLFSRHVDLKTPGDRGSDCRSLMEAIGLFNRRNGEQVLVHQCLGCGVVRNNRIAADDNYVATMRLPVVNTDSAGDRLEEIEEETA